MTDEYDPYYQDPAKIAEIRHELSMLGIEELTTPEAVEGAVSSDGTVLLFVNCNDEVAADQARPAIALAMQHDVLPNTIRYVFAGQSLKAAARARDYFTGYFPTSPQIAILRDAKVLYMCDRDDMEKRLRTPDEIAKEITQAFDEHCNKS